LKEYKKTLLAGIIASLFGGASMMTNAQEAVDDKEPASAQSDKGSISLEVIEVTAQKRSESARDVPLAISALSGDKIKTGGYDEISDLQVAVPSLKTETTYYGNPVFFIRGVGFSDPIATVTPAVSTYVDQVPLPYSIMSRGAILDLERVEVLKGPQGTLFGQNATGGAINFIAAKPTDDFTAGFNLNYGRFNNTELEGYVSGPISDTLRYRLAARVEKQDDWQTSQTRPGDERGQRDFFNTRLSLDWDASDTVQIRLTGQAWEDKSDLPGGQLISVEFQRGLIPGLNDAPYEALPLVELAPDKARVAEWDEGSPTAVDNSFYQLALEANIALSDTIDLVSITAISDIEAYAPTDLDSTAFVGVFGESFTNIDFFYQELRLSGDLGDGQWMLGANYSKEEYDVLNVFVNNNTSAIGFNSNAPRGDSSIDSYGIFASYVHTLSDTITARGSIRYTDITDDHNGCLQDAGPGSNLFAVLGLSDEFIGQCVTLDADTFQPGEVNVENKEDNIAWRVGLDWKPTNDMLIYGNIGKGYKSGAFTTPPAISSSQLQPLEQESVLAYELGMKSSYLNKRVNFDVSAFFYDYADKQLGGVINIQPFGALPTLVSIPESEVLGFEAEITALVTDYTRLQMAATYLDTEVKADPDLPLSPFGEQGSFVGERFPQTSEWAYNVNLEHFIPFGKDGSEAYFGANVSYRDQAYTSFGYSYSERTEELLTIDAYTLVDLRAGVQFDDGLMGVEVWGRNVTDEFYLTNALQTTDTAYRYVGMPATYGVRVFWNFY